MTSDTMATIAEAVPETGEPALHGIAGSYHYNGTMACHRCPRIDPQYRRMVLRAGATIHVGYIIAGRWFAFFRPVEFGPA
jgi:hypothetical protein